MASGTSNNLELEVSKEELKEVEELGNFKKGFDPFKKADLNLAEKHRQARRIRKVNQSMQNSRIEKCECCGFPVDAEPFSVFCSLHELGEIGPGFPMYFILIKILCFIVFIGICIVGIPCLASNVNAGEGNQWQANEDSWTLTASIGNHGYSNEIIPVWYSYLHIVYMIVILIIYHLGRRYLSEKEFEIDISTITPKDYSVHAYGLPFEFTENDVKHFFSQYGRDDNKVAEVVKVNFPYKIRDYMENLRKIEDLSEKIKELEINEKQGLPAVKKNSCGKEKSLNDLQKEKESVDEEIRKFEHDLPSGVGKELLIGQAFVTFQTQADARSVENKYAKQWVHRIWSSFFFAFFGCCRKKDTLKKKGENIYARMAHEPSDIFWENLETSFKNRIRYFLLTYLMTFVVILISFAAVYGMKRLGEIQENEYVGQKNVSASTSWKIRIYSLWPSICIIIINFVLGRLTRVFTSFEKPHSITDYNISVALKLTIAMFFNTALVTLIVNYSWQDDWFKPGGLMSDATYIMFSNAFVSPLIYLFSPMVLVHKIKMKLAEKVEKGKYLSQLDANNIFEDLQVDMAQRYANSGKTILLTLCYTPLIPVALFITLAGLIFEYWVSKVLLLKRHSWPKRLSGELSEVIIHFIPWAVLVYSIMNYVTFRYLSPIDDKSALVWMILVIIYIFIPFESLYRLIVKKNVDLFENMYKKETYESVAIAFLDDYDRLNPVTTTEGWQWLADLLERKKVINDEKVQGLKKKLEIQNDEKLKNMRKFAIKRKSMNKHKNEHETVGFHRSNNRIHNTIKEIQGVITQNLATFSKKFNKNVVLPEEKFRELNPEDYDGKVIDYLVDYENKGNSGDTNVRRDSIDNLIIK